MDCESSLNGKPSGVLEFCDDFVEDPTITMKDDIIHYHEAQSIGLLLLDHNHKVIEYVRIVDDRAQYIFPNMLTGLIHKHSKDILETLCSTPYLTIEDNNNFRSAIKCSRCDRSFSKGGRDKHCHHCHYT